MTIVLMLIAVGSVIAIGALALRAIAATRREAAVCRLLAVFAPVAATAQEDPRRLLAWYPIAQAGRRIFPEEFKILDAAAGGTFPFTKDQLKAAHARWTADWLAWERTHDADYAVRTAEAEAQIGRAAERDAAAARTRLAAIEREKLERYQQRYEEYVRVGKALAALME